MVLVLVVSYLAGFLSGADVGIAAVLVTVLFCAMAVWPTRPSLAIGLTSVVLAVVVISTVVAYNYMVYPFLKFERFG